jgi:hypothetical protein
MAVGNGKWWWCCGIMAGLSCEGFDDSSVCRIKINWVIQLLS